MSAGKIAAIFISEFVEAVLFIMTLLILSSFPDFTGKDSIISFVISAWVLFGIATPFAIWFEVTDIIAEAFKGVKLR